jgi:nucleotide-binding universal stress UspA family protein
MEVPDCPSLKIASSSVQGEMRPIMISRNLLFLKVLSIGTFVAHALDASQNMKRIMVPTDFSEGSFEALKYAIKLMQNQELNLLIVHVIEPLPHGIGRWYEPTKLLERYAEEAATELERFEKRAKGALYPRCRSELHFGVIQEVIRQVARKNHIDLVVTSMGETAHLLHLLIGSTALKILRCSPCPVLRVCAADDPKLEALQDNHELSPELVQHL